MQALRRTGHGKLARAGNPDVLNLKRHSEQVRPALVSAPSALAEPHGAAVGQDR
jgi:hypothetical protein